MLKIQDLLANWAIRGWCPAAGCAHDYSNSLVALCRQWLAGVAGAWRLHARGRALVGWGGPQPAGRGGHATACRGRCAGLARARALLAPGRCRDDHALRTDASAGLGRQTVHGAALRVPGQRAVRSAGRVLHCGSLRRRCPRRAWPGIPLRAVSMPWSARRPSGPCWSCAMAYRMRRGLRRPMR